MTDAFEDIFAEIEEEVEVEEDKIFTRKELNNSRTRLRSALVRDHEASEKRAKLLASQLLAGQGTYVSRRREDARLEDAIVYGVSGLAGRVLNSLNITPQIKANVDNSLSRDVAASTDFKDIHLTVNTKRFKVGDLESMGELLHIVKGLVYHEGGHILYSKPLNELCKDVGCTTQHKVGDFPPGFIPEDMEPADQAAFYGATHHAWNILEDQRMETAMIATSPVMARYLTTLVCKNVVNEANPEVSWPWLVGRTYLPREFRQALRDAAESHPRSDLIPEIESLVMRYRASNDSAEMHDCVLRMAIHLISWLKGYATPQNVDTHNGRGSGKQPGNTIPVPTPPDYELEQPSAPSQSDETDSNEQSSNQGDGQSNQGQDASQPNQTRGDKGIGMPQSTKNQSDGASNSKRSNEGNRTAGHDSGPKSIKDAVEEIVNDNLSKASMDEVTSFVSDINHSRSALAPRARDLRPMLPSQSKAVVDIRNGMMDVLDKLIVQVDPTWSFYQENGVLDPTAYALRDPGDLNFWSGMNGDQGNGHDLAVSLLVDSSGSMNNEIDKASIIAMGIRRSCEHYAIPCTITTFSDTVYLVASGDEETDDVQLDAGGGTHVFDAMTLLDQQRYGKRYHLVVILTDGEWGDLRDVRAWGDPTRHIMLVGYSIGHELIANKGANSCVTISNLNDLAPLVTNALAGYFTN